MKTNIGLWFDHKQTSVVTMSNKGEEIRRITLEVEKQLQHSSDPLLNVPYGAQPMLVT